GEHHTLSPAVVGVLPPAPLVHTGHALQDALGQAQALAGRSEHLIDLVRGDGDLDRDISTESRLAFLWTNPVCPFPICVRYLVRRVLRVRAVPASHGRGTGPGAVPGRAHAPIIVPLVPEGGAGWCPMTRRDQGP